MKIVRLSSLFIGLIGAFFFLGNRTLVLADYIPVFVDLSTVPVTHMRISTAAPAAAVPKMEFKQSRQNFGMIRQGQQTALKFEFVNSGNLDLVIQRLTSSCGCTAAVASSGPYRPGESGVIDVTYDSRGKIGHTIKEVQVFSNDPQSPKTIALEGEVHLEAGHPPMNPGDVLFAGSCADCHAVPAKGKTGKDLYNAVCFMCHDFPQQSGKKAIAADQSALSQLPEKELKKLISKGMLGTSMPGFLEAHGGPLTKQQIKSLVEYLMNLKQKE